MLRLRRSRRGVITVLAKYRPADPCGSAGFLKTKNATGNRWRIYVGGDKSDSALNLVGAEASGTSVHMAGSTVDNRLDTLHIGLPGTVGTSVGVRNLNTKGHALAAKITLSHFIAPPIEKVS